MPVPPSTWSPRRPLEAYRAKRPYTQSPVLFVTTWGRPKSSQPRPVSPEYLERIMSTVGRTVGVHLSHNRCRHTVATRFREAGWDPLDIRDYLGHTKIQETYMEIPRRLERAMRKRPPPDFYQGGS